MKDYLHFGLLFMVIFTAPAGEKHEPSGDVTSVRRTADIWRSEHRLIDLHQHIDYAEDRLARAVRVMDAAGLGIAVNLSGGTVTRKDGAPSEFELHKQLADRLFPGRFVHYMNLDYSGWDEPDFPERAAKQIEEGFRLGAAGFKEFKRLGLNLRDQAGKLIRIDDAKLDPVWKKCGELRLPVSIHVADPRAFWLPYDEKNERWTELKDHRNWWYGDPAVYPPREELLAAINRVIERHPQTTFVCVHFANNAEDIAWVDKMLDRYPNLNADLAARIPELGRHDPSTVRRLFIKHQDRILFGTDFQVYGRLTLGSGGSGPAPTDDDAKEFYAKHWRWLETTDRAFAHMTPIQGNWTIDAIGLPAPVLRKIYFDNARKLLARSLPPPVIRARHVSQEISPGSRTDRAAWQTATPAHLEYQSGDSMARPELSTAVRALWSKEYLYLRYECPFTKLTVFKPAKPTEERFGLWERDVVEAFIGADPGNLNRYAEFEVAPNNEKLDVILDLPSKDFNWNSEFKTAVGVDAKAQMWVAELRIPIAALSKALPTAGSRWRINLYRCDYANKAFLAWNPTLTNTFHAPEKFGILEFSE